MVMWKLKSCPRCGGDLFLDGDPDNTWYEQCLLCSYRHALESILEFKQREESWSRKLRWLAASPPVNAGAQIKKDGREEIDWR